MIIRREAHLPAAPGACTQVLKEVSMTWLSSTLERRLRFVSRKCKLFATMALSGKGEEGEGRGGKGSEGKGQGGENDGSENNRNVDFAIL